MIGFKTLTTASFFTFALTAQGSVMAQDSDSWQLEGDVYLSSHLLDRGLLLSSRDISVSASVLLLKGDFFSGVYVANPTNETSFDTEVELFAGFTKPLGGWDLTITGELDSFHGGAYTALGTSYEASSRFFPEIKASVARDYGLVYLVAGSSWSMKGRWSDNADSVYVWSDMELPIPGVPSLTLLTHMGYDMRQKTTVTASSRAFDWSVGMSVFINDFEVTAYYSDSKDDRFDPVVGNRGAGRLSAGLRFYF